MDVKIDKKRFHVLLIKLFSSLIGKITTSGDYVKGDEYIELFDRNGDNFAEIWFEGAVVVPKKCKKYLSLHVDTTERLEQFVPVLRKKQYAKSLIDYVYHQTGIKCDCIEFEHSFKYDYDDDGDLFNSSSLTYRYKKKK